MLVLLVIICRHRWINNYNQDVKQIFTVCFKLGHKTKLTDQWTVFGNVTFKGNLFHYKIIAIRK